MKKFALIGEKLGHSYSPEIHKAAMKKLGVEGEYSLLEVSCDQLSQVTDSIREGLLNGINVTIPYKVDIIRHLDKITPEAEAIGAVNTVVLEEGKLIGYNTDYWGFKYTLDKMEIDLTDKNCVVLGGGGSARAVIKTLQDLGGRVFLVSRSPEKLKESFGGFLGLNIISYRELEDLDGELIVNTTPVGMFPNTDACVIEKEIIRKFSYGIDLIYNPRETLFLKRTSIGVNGLYMLVGQAVRAEELWWKKNLTSFEDIFKETEELVYKK